MGKRVTVIGTGNVGGNLGARLSRSGVSVKFGARDGDDAVASLLQRCADDASVDTVAAAADWAEVVLLAVPGSIVAQLARELAPQLEGKVVVDCTNSMTWDGGPIWAPPAEGSNAAAIAAAAPGARVVKGFNTFGAEFHADPSLPGSAAAQVFLAGDDAGAKEAVTALAEQAGFRVVDAGPLRNAAVVENLAILWIHLAMAGGHGRDWTFVMQERA